MRIITLGLMALISMTQAVQAQDLTGQWQGALKAGERELRIVMKVANGPQGNLTAAMYSIDQAGGTPIPANMVSFQGGVFKFAIQQLNGSYEGRISADGNAINGTWTQGQAGPLNFARATQQTA